MNYNNINIYRHDGTNWVEISSYVNKSGTNSIPFIERNSDWTPVASTFDIAITSRFPYVISVNDKFKFVIDGVNVFSGYATEVIYDYTDKYWKVSLTHNLNLLDNYKLEYNVLDNIIVSGTSDLFEYNPNDSGMPVLNLMYSLKCCFAVASMSLDTSLIDNVIYDNSHTPYPISFTYTPPDYNGHSDIESWESKTTPSVPYNRLCLDKNMFYAINQPDAVYHTDIDDPNKNYESNKITLLDYVKEIFRIFQLNIVCSDYDSFYLIKDASEYTISSKDKFDYEIRYLASEQKGDVHINIRHALYGRTYYDIVGYPQPNYDHYILNYYGYDPSNTSTELDWYDNLVITPYLCDSTGTTFINKMPSLSQDSQEDAVIYGEFIGGWNHIICSKIFQYSLANIQQTTMTCPIQTAYKNVTRNFINIVDYTSEIEQESYL